MHVRQRRSARQPKETRPGLFFLSLLSRQGDRDNAGCAKNEHRCGSHATVQYAHCTVQYLHAPRRASLASSFVPHAVRGSSCFNKTDCAETLRPLSAAAAESSTRTVLSSDYVSRCAKKAPPRVHELGRRARIVDECSLRSFLLHPRTARHLHRLLHLTRVVRRLTVAGLFCHPARARSNLYDLLGMSAQLVLDKIRALFPPGSPAS